jgi:hypothetical protein
MTSKPCPFGPQSCPPPPVVAVAESVPEGMDPASWIAGHTAGQILANSRYLAKLHIAAAASLICSHKGHPTE